VATGRNCSLGALGVELPGNGLKAGPTCNQCLEEFLRTHISDEKTLNEGLSLLRFLGTERACFFVGVSATLE
jgi:hypothetical protein